MVNLCVTLEYLSDHWASSECSRSLALLAAAPDLGRGVTPLGRCPLGMGSSRLLPLTSDVGWLLLAVLSVPVGSCLRCKIRRY